MLCKPFLFSLAGVGGGAASSRVQLQTPTIADSQCTLAQPITATDLNQQQEQQQQAQEAELDFNAVQRGDAEMQNRMNRVLRACIELGDSISVGSGTSAGTGARCVSNPIVSIHDQGAGGNGNVLKEIVAPLGARIRLKDIPSGDPTLSGLHTILCYSKCFLCNPLIDLPRKRQISQLSITSNQYCNFVA